MGKNGTNTNKKDKKDKKDKPKEEKPKSAKKNTKKKKDDDTNNTNKSKKNNKGKGKGKGKGNKTPTPSTKSNGKTQDLKLKQWMDQYNVYEKQLHSALVSNNIDSSQKIKKMNQAKFDSIVRKYRVDRFAKTKNQKARNKIDKSLLSFEKAWRKTKKGTKTK